MRKKKSTECHEELRQMQQNIRSGRNPHWKIAVESLLFEERTTKMGLKIEEAGLIIAYRTGTHDWTMGIQPMKTDRPYDQIADHCRATHGVPAGFHLGEHKSVELIDDDPKEELEVAMIPIGLVVVGKTREDLWADEVAPAAASLFAQILGRDNIEVIGDIVQLAYSWASETIRVLSGQPPQSADLVRNIDTDETHLLPGGDEPGGFEL